jgi:uncharacterized protein YijF (DUF1287 family)
MRAMALLLVCLLPAGAEAVRAADLAADLARAAEARDGLPVRYDPAYVRLSYPLGDVPEDTGVCSDEVIRAFRAVGIDLQRLVHEDMARAFARYPRNWGLTRADRNIDHRRVPNLETFFRRRGAALPVGTDPSAFRPGDVVSWRLPDGRPHIGLVTARVSAAGTPLILHNIGAGPRIEDMLFAFAIAGHFRYAGP